MSDGLDWMDGWLSYTAVTLRASLKSDANKDLSALSHFPTDCHLASKACAVSMVVPEKARFSSPLLKKSNDYENLSKENHLAKVIGFSVR